MNKRTGQVVIGLVVSGIFIYLLASNLAIDEVLATFQSLSPIHLAAAIAVYYLALLPRSFRWRALLSPVKTMPPRRLFAYVMIGLMANEVLPARGGELVRAALLGRRERVSSAAILVTVVVERVFDVLSLIFFLGLLVATLELPELLRGGGTAAAVAAFGTLAILWLAAANRDRIRRLGLLLSQLLPSRLASILAAQLEGVLAGLGVMREPRQLLAVTIYSLLSWGLLIVSTHLFLQAMDLWLPWQAPVMVIVSTGLGMILPSSPGAIGVFHWFAAKALELSPWQVPWSTAVAFAFVFHTVSYLLNFVAGLVCLALEGLGWRDLTRVDVQDPKPSVASPT